MAILKLYSDIVDNETKVFYNYNGLEATSSDDVVNLIGNIPQDDSEISIRINCNGGYVTEGWRMYDALRQSGKKISAVVEGMCASMATVILMAAPKERRYAYENASFLIHDPAACYPSIGGCPERFTADELEKMADKINIQAQTLREEEERILNLYVERTNTDIETLRSLMKEETKIGTNKAMELGFISSTLAPNTDFNKTMNKNEAKVEVGQNWLTRLIAKAGFKSAEAVKFNDLSFTAVDGNTFSVEREEGMYAVGDTASPDGKYVMEDGSTVSIENGAIADIIPAKMEIKHPETGEVISEDEAQQLLNTYSAKIKDLEAAAQQSLEDANAKDEAHAAEVKDLNDTISNVKDELAKAIEEKPSEEDKAMLDVIAKAGGKAWFDVIVNAQSDGAPKNPQTAFKGTSAEERLGDGFLDDVKKKSRRIKK